MLEAAWGLGSMREPLEVFTASRMQHMVQIRQKTHNVVTTHFSILYISYLALGVESPAYGAIGT